jgi:hypothetical protein
MEIMELRSRLMPSLIRLAVELEGDNVGRKYIDDNPLEMLDAPLAWLDRHGAARLLWSNRPVIENDHKSVQTLAEAIKDAPIDDIERAISGLHHALFTADEVEQLDGEAALNYVAGWIGGAAPWEGGVSSADYLSRISFYPTYRSIFGLGYELGRDFMMANQGKKNAQIA